MARTTSFRIGVSKTVNLGNFNSIRVEASIEVEIPETDDRVVTQVTKQNAQAELRTLLAETYRAQKKGEYDENS